MVEQQRNPVISQSKAPEILSSILTVLNMKQEVSSSSSSSVLQSQHPRQHFDNFFAKTKMETTHLARGSSASPSSSSKVDCGGVGCSAPRSTPSSSPSTSSADAVISSSSLNNLTPIFASDDGCRDFRRAMDTNHDDNNNNEDKANYNYGHPAGYRY